MLFGENYYILVMARTRPSKLSMLELLNPMFFRRGILGYDKTLGASLSEMGSLHFNSGPGEHRVRSRKSGKGLHQASTWQCLSLGFHCFHTVKNISGVFEESYSEQLCYGSIKILTSPQEKRIQISRSRIFFSITCY